MRRLAIIGSGIAALGAAWRLKNRFDIRIYDHADRPGGHTHTHRLPVANGGHQPVDTGFIVFNHETYPLLTALFAELGVESAPTSMSFSVTNQSSNLFWSSLSLNSVFSQRDNLVSPRFWRMIFSALRFARQAPRDLAAGRAAMSLGEYLEKTGYNSFFRDNFILPMGSAVWSTPVDSFLRFPAETFIRFFVNHRFTGVTRGLQWRFVRGGSSSYIDNMFARHPFRLSLNDRVTGVRRQGDSVAVNSQSGREMFDACLLACHADEALALIENPSPAQRHTLTPFRYTRNIALLHTDSSIMPRRRDHWASWNFISDRGGRRSSTVYYMNRLQSIPGPIDYFVSINGFQSVDPKKIIREIEYFHPLFDTAALRSQARLPELNSEGPLFFAGSYFRYGFHEDALSSGYDAAAAIDRRFAER